MFHVQEFILRQKLLLVSNQNSIKKLTKDKEDNLLNPLLTRGFFYYLCCMDNLKKILFATIDYHTKGVDTYYNGGSMWLIFTDRKKWVIELTKDGTLWYNHYFFNDCFKYLSLDAVENQHYITKWVEDIIQNGLINTFGVDVDLNHLVEDTIQNGVKETDFHAGNLLYDVEDTIQNGVKHTEPGGYLGSIEMKGKIVHQLESPKQNEEVEDVIENGIKETKWRRVDNYPTYLDKILKSNNF
jgi:hypothetical protein